MEYPQCIQRFIAEMSDDNARELFVWLDETPHVASELLDLLLKNPAVKSLCDK